VPGLRQALSICGGSESMDKIKKFVTEHPQWTSWIVLSIGMVAILVWSARDVGLLPGQWAALIIATILVAGLAVWIIGWEDEEDLADEALEREEPGPDTV
jgi:MFS superfamily sulfate permease-like transporter